MYTEHELIHEICEHIKFVENNTECLKCPARVDSPYGPGTQMCYLVAQNLIEMVRQFDKACKIEDAANGDISP